MIPVRSFNRKTVAVFGLARTGLGAVAALVAGGARVLAWDDAAMAALESYTWPGNVRELQNVVERACALAENDAVGVRDLPDHVRAGARAGLAPSGPELPSELPVAAADVGLKEAKERWLAVLEASYLRQLLDRHAGNISAAAKAAGIDRKTFHRLINKHQIRG